MERLVEEWMGVSSPAFLVTGATGSVGREVVRGLLAAGHRVRAVTRDPRRADLPDAVDLREGDLADAASIVPALDGIDRLYLFPAGDVHEVSAAAAAAGVEHVVLLSSASVGYDVPDYSSLHHRAAEQAVTDAGLSHTFLRPGAFMGNDLMWAGEVAATATISIPYPEAATAPIDERDIAAAALAALCDPSAVDPIIEMTGPQSLTQRRRIELLAEATNDQITVVELSADAARKAMARYLPLDAVELIIGVLAAAPPVVSAQPVPSHLLRREPHGYLEWAARNANAFSRGAASNQQKRS